MVYFSVCKMFGMHIVNVIGLLVCLFVGLLVFICLFLRHPEASFLNKFLCLWKSWRLRSVACRRQLAPTRVLKNCPLAHLCQDLNPDGGYQRRSYSL
jgi:hypothetical protein